MEMSMGFLFLVMAVVARTAATQPVLTIMSPDGDIVDCININDQPAFDHPLLRNHTVLEAPAYLPDIDDTSWQVWHGNGTECPKRTIPVRQLNRTTGSQPGQEATLGHEIGANIRHKQHIMSLSSPRNSTPIVLRSEMKLWELESTSTGLTPGIETATEAALTIRRKQTEVEGIVNAEVRSGGSGSGGSGEETPVTAAVIREQRSLKLNLYAIGALDSPPGPPSKIYGAKATFNVWRPKVEQATEFSLAQIWIISGSYDNNTLNSIEAGWQTDAYTSTMCYNLRCPGFVKTSRTVLIEGAISPASTIGGLQTELTIQVWKRGDHGGWELVSAMGPSSGRSDIGRSRSSAGSLITQRTFSGGGEIVDIRASGRHTTTEMGSGYRPGSDRAAYVRDLQVALSPGEFVPVSRLIVGATNAAYYSVEKYSNSSFSYGGPHGTAVHL
ncbi:hypothetical protein F2Q69_00004245, partial [Brassica cretica]